MLQIKKLFSNVYVDGSIYLDNLVKPFCVYKETLFLRQNHLYFFPYHSFILSFMIIRFASFYSCLKTASLTFFFRFSMRCRGTMKARILSHIAEWAIRSSTNIVIWEMNSRALNKHAVVAVTGRTWSYSRARICKWQCPPVYRGDGFSFEFQISREIDN